MRTCWPCVKKPRRDAFRETAVDNPALRALTHDRAHPAFATVLQTLTSDTDTAPRAWVLWAPKRTLAVDLLQVLSMAIRSSPWLSVTCRGVPQLVRRRLVGVHQIPTLLVRDAHLSQVLATAGVMSVDGLAARMPQVC